MPSTKTDRAIWVIHGKSYDFTPFVDKHPGGRQAIMLGANRDATVLFESYHTRLPSDKVLAKYAIKDDTAKAASKTGDHPIEGERVPHFTFEEDGFYRTIKRRALEHFTQVGGGKYNMANTKGGAGAALGLVALIFSLSVSSYYMLTAGSLIAAVVCGLSRHLSIVGPTHSASHFSLFMSPLMNRLTLALLMVLNGESPLQWTTKHVVAHHVSTNITPTDDDTMWPIKRSTPTLGRMWHHQFQTIYMGIVYPLTLTLWAVSHTLKAIIAAVTKTTLWEGETPVVFTSWVDKAETGIVLGLFWVWRLAPFVFLPAGQAFAAIVVCELFASVPFALQFAVNHERMEPMRFAGNYGSKPLSNIDWGEHQTVTSANYAVASWFWLHFSGGLNTQIEHHLFPSVSYVHYRELAAIVQDECAKRNIPYANTGSFAGAVADHWNLLKVLGTMDDLPLA